MIVTYIQERHPANEKLLNRFLKAKLIYSDLFLSDLKIDEPRRLRDSYDSSYKCFLNCIIRIKASEIEFIDYEDLDFPIHSSQIIQHEYNADCNSKSDYETFIKDIAGNDNFQSFCSAIGYLSTNFKCQHLAKAVILNDPDTSFEEANGGRGKSLISKGISMLSNLTRIDGKQYKSEDSFSLASVKETDDVVFIDDVKQGFHFTNFYNLITDDFEMTKKYSNKQSIPFELAPKLLLSSNYPIKGSDSSSKRRRFDLVLTDYYSVNNAPIKKFGKEFFTSWSESEWSAFFNFMIECIQLYLSKGLIQMNVQSMELKDLIGDTSSDFISFMEENKESLMQDYFSLESVKQDYLRYSNQNISARKLKGWLSKWCKHFEFNLSETRRNNQRLHKLSKPKVILGDFAFKAA